MNYWLIFPNAESRVPCHLVYTFVGRKLKGAFSNYGVVHSARYSWWYFTLRLLLCDFFFQQTTAQDPYNEPLKAMEVCTVCGALLVVGDAQQRVDEHIMGKQHSGYARIRAYVEGKRMVRTLTSD